MTHFRIIEVYGSIFKLENIKSGKTEELLLEFYKMDKPMVGDIFVISDSLLDRNSVNFVQPYAFTLTNEKEIKEKKIAKEDIAGISRSNINILLKRLYG